MVPSIGIIIVPGCSCAPIETANWYKWLADKLSSSHDLSPISVICETMPDPVICSENLWIPFIKKKLHPYKYKFVIGHSSGALAGMRLAESTNIYKTYLISPALSDGGCERERSSGYYPEQMDGSSRPWKWNDMLKNSSFTIFSGEDDRLIPIDEMRTVAKQLHLHDTIDYIEFKKKEKKGHFLRGEFPELLERIKTDLRKLIYLGQDI